VDSFSYGKPSRGGLAPMRLMMLAAVGVVAVGLAFAIMQVTKSGGEQVVKHVKKDVEQADVAGDQAARVTLSTAMTAAQMTFAETGSYEGVTPQTLAATEVSLHYTSGPSTGPDVVSVASNADGLGLAVLSRSGTCFYLHASVTGPSQGSGAVCTGQAALSA
jgi:hypothetical protein